VATRCKNGGEIWRGGSRRFVRHALRGNVCDKDFAIKASELQNGFDIGQGNVCSWVQIKAKSIENCF